MLSASLRKSSHRVLDKLGPLASLGSTRDTLRRQAQLAEQGCDFLPLHASTREEVDRVMNVVRRLPFRLAQKFHRFAIEDLS